MATWKKKGDTRVLEFPGCSYEFFGGTYPTQLVVISREGRFALRCRPIGFPMEPLKARTWPAALAEAEKMARKKIETDREVLATMLKTLDEMTKEKAHGKNAAATRGRRRR